MGLAVAPYCAIGIYQRVRTSLISAIILLWHRVAPEKLQTLATLPHFYIRYTVKVGVIMQEIWKDIPSFEGKYQVSNFGNVKSLNYLRTNTPRLLKQNNHKDGYKLIGLSNEKTGKKKYFTVHRLVAQAFIPNPENKATVNHIDGNKANNHVSNLEWATPQENMIHSFKIGLRKNQHKGRSRKRSSGKRYNGIYKSPVLGQKGVNNHNHTAVLQYDLNGNFIKKWDCMADACRFYNANSGAISQCANNKRKTAYGFIWKKPS